MWVGVLMVLLIAAPTLAEDGGQERPAGDDQAGYDDTDRFYFYLETGHSFILDEHFVSDTDFDTPDGFNSVMGGGGGYNLTDHWGIEIQGHGSEPELRSDRFGKVKEFSNITVAAAVRYRYPLQDGRFVPYLTGGVGFSLNDVNDTSKPLVKIEGDDTTVAGTLAAGFDYFLAPNVAVGGSLHSWIYPDVDTGMVVRDSYNRVVFVDDSNMNLTSIALMAHIRLFPGQPGSPDGRRPRRLLIAEQGPFDGDERRYYVYVAGGDALFLDDDFGAGVKLEAPGSVNWALGGGLGLNLNGRWGVELQLLNSDPNLQLDGIGKFAEMSNFVVLPQVRYRWQFWRGRLVPFATAGVGVTFNDINDRRGMVDVYRAGSRWTPVVDVDESSVVGSIGIGVEYFLNRNISLALSMPFYIYPDWDTLVQSRGKGGQLTGMPADDSMNYTGFAPMIRLTAYVP